MIDVLDSPSELNECLDDLDYQAGIIWGCCKARGGDAQGCAVREHLVRAGKVARKKADRWPVGI
jgi:hypothetical protein